MVKHFVLRRGVAPRLPSFSEPSFIMSKNQFVEILFCLHPRHALYPFYRTTRFFRRFAKLRFAERWMFSRFQRTQPGRAPREKYRSPEYSERCPAAMWRNWRLAGRCKSPILGATNAPYPGHGQSFQRRKKRAGNSSPALQETQLYLNVFRYR